MTGCRSQLGASLACVLCALSAQACRFLNEPPSDSEIDRYYDSVERCTNEPTGIACCSRSSATLLSGGSQKHAFDWSERKVPPLTDDMVGWDGNERSWSSQHSLRLSRGAALELEVERDRQAGDCDTVDPWQSSDAAHATIEIFGELSDPTSTWISYAANGRLVARLAGEDYDDCRPESKLRIHVDLRPGVDGEDVVLGSLGIQPSSSDDLRDVSWLRKDISLGPVRAFTDGQRVQLISKGELASPGDIRQYQGACASASMFEPFSPPFDPKALGADQWAATLGEAALLIAPASLETPQQSWEILFSGERLTEAGVARRRGIGYSKSFGDGGSEGWVSVPNESRPLLGTSASNALSLDVDYREPSLALAKPGVRVIAYTAGREATHLEIGSLVEGEMHDVTVVDTEATRGACSSLSQPALVKQASGYLLYFTCCSDPAYECGSGDGDDTLWLAHLDDALELDMLADARPRRVAFDRAGEMLLRAGKHIVSAEPVALGGQVRMWLVVQDELQKRAVMLAQSGEHAHEFVFHTSEAVLTADDLCPGETCRMESVAVARAPGEYSVRLAVLVSHVGQTEVRQSIHLLSQSLEVPW